METGTHKMRSVFDRYNIIDEGGMEAAGEKMTRYFAQRKIQRAAKLRRGCNDENHYKTTTVAESIRNGEGLGYEVVRMIGLEPTLPRGNWNLNPARLPISPHPQFYVMH
jgi:hypothetical protein